MELRDTEFHWCDYVAWIEWFKKKQFRGVYGEVVLDALDNEGMALLYCAFVDAVNFGEEANAVP